MRISSSPSTRRCSKAWVARGPSQVSRSDRGALQERNHAQRRPEVVCCPLCNSVSELLRELLGEMSERLRFIENRLKQYDLRIAEFARAGRLMAVEGVGPLTATALIAAVGNERQFRSGRELSAWLGLVPRQHSSGGRSVLLGINKRGDRYLRTLLIHGARATLRFAARKRDPRSRWIRAMGKRRGTNIAAVALANKRACCRRCSRTTRITASRPPPEARRGGKPCQRSCEGCLPS
jgi:transposase